MIRKYIWKQQRSMGCGIAAQSLSLELQYQTQPTDMSGAVSG